ncbi:MAG: hypothetical protein HZA78_07290 [Candidatus Schekmanbacteria bacterium]|nr:hypothetical protein [Candidatus Schekmanbacteria bacterium]
MNNLAAWMLTQEARALLTRLDRVRPFALHMPMVTAAAISPAAQVAIESHMIRGKKVLKTLVHNYIRWLLCPQGQQSTPDIAQRRFNIIRFKFNHILTQFDIFADVLSQRSEHETGVWVAGLDDAAADALALPGYYHAPPVICYLDRGHGAAIRRAHTRLPGGNSNPVAVIQIPRERMVGSGIASSLVHEVGHQAAALLNLNNSFRPVLREMQRKDAPHRIAWQFWERWISEVIPDFWAVAKVGITATAGLINVVSLPRALVFRLDMEDPHPAPYMRVKLGCALGQALYPHRQWDNLNKLWESFYPLTGVNQQICRQIAGLEATLPGLVYLLVNHRPLSLRGKSLKEALNVGERQPARLSAYYQMWHSLPNRAYEVLPTLAFAVIGQAKSDGKITPEEESDRLAKLLTYWAVRSALNASAVGAAQPKLREAQKMLF